MKQFVLALLVVFGVAIAPAHAASIVLSPSANPILSGSFFTVTVTVTDPLAGLDPFDEVLGFGFDVAVTNPFVVFVSASIAPPFNDDSALVGLDAAGSAFPGTTLNPLLLATLTFQAVSPGVTSIRIQSNTLDPNQGLFYALSAPLDISGNLTPVTVSAAATPVPEPGTLLLVGAGAVALYRRKRPV